MEATQILSPQITADELSKFVATSHKAGKRVVLQITVEDQPEEITVAQAMQLLNCSRQHLTNLVNKGTIKKMHKTLGKIWYNRAELLTLKEEGRL